MCEIFLHALQGELLGVKGHGCTRHDLFGNITELRIQFKTFWRSLFSTGHGLFQILFTLWNSLTIKKVLIRYLVHIPLLKIPYCMGADILWKSRRYLKIAGARSVKWSKFHPQNSQILLVTIQNFFAPVTWRPGFVHPCLNIQYFSSQAYNRKGCW